MANEKDLAVLSLYVYEADSRNKPDIPTGWSILTDAVGTSGFAYAVFQGSAHEIVISYRGSDDGVDWLTNLGLTSTQELQAAQIAVQYINQGANVSFTGHSLGGGLAATMAVWFNRPATVFDPAPTQNAATDPVLVNQGMQAIVGDRRVDAKGATITLSEGQTEVAFALVQKGGLNEDASGSLSVSLQSQSSNDWQSTQRKADGTLAGGVGDVAKGGAGNDKLVVWFSQHATVSIADNAYPTGTIGRIGEIEQAANDKFWRGAA